VSPCASLAQQYPQRLPQARLSLVLTSLLPRPFPPLAASSQTWTCRCLRRRIRSCQSSRTMSSP
jgi:hypothetical protein